MKTSFPAIATNFLFVPARASILVGSSSKLFPSTTLESAFSSSGFVLISIFLSASVLLSIIISTSSPKTSLTIFFKSEATLSSLKTSCLIGFLKHR